MILLTGATGTVGTRLLPRLIEAGRSLRVLVRDPQDLGASRVDVQLALGDLADANSLRHSTRGVDTVVHLAATFRDQDRSGGSIEQINGLATARLLRAAEQAGAERFIYMSCLGADALSGSRFVRSKAAAEKDVLESDLASTVISTSSIHAPDSIWERIVSGLSVLPVTTLPSGTLRAHVQPVTAEDVAAAVFAEIARGAPDSTERPRRVELAGDQATTQFSYLAGLAMRRHHRSVRLPLPLVEAKLRLLTPFIREGRLPTPDELEMLSISLWSEKGSSDLRALDIEPTPVNPLTG
jgi:NADH dehydrogenase